MFFLDKTKHLCICAVWWDWNEQCKSTLLAFCALLWGGLELPVQEDQMSEPLRLLVEKVVVA